MFICIPVKGSATFFTQLNLGEHYDYNNWKQFLLKLHRKFTMFWLWKDRLDIKPEHVLDFLDVWCNCDKSSDPDLWRFFLPYRRIWLHKMPSDQELLEVAWEARRLTSNKRE
jgi:hypothetical protein